MALLAVGFGGDRQHHIDLSQNLIGATVPGFDIHQRIGVFTTLIVYRKNRYSLGGEAFEVLYDVADVGQADEERQVFDVAPKLLRYICGIRGCDTWHGCLMCSERSGFVSGVGGAVRSEIELCQVRRRQPEIGKKGKSTENTRRVEGFIGGKAVGTGIGIGRVPEIRFAYSRGVLAGCRDRVDRYRRKVGTVRILSIGLDSGIGDFYAVIGREDPRLLAFFNDLGIEHIVRGQDAEDPVILVCTVHTQVIGGQDGVIAVCDLTISITLAFIADYPFIAVGWRFLDAFYRGFSIRLFDQDVAGNRFHFILLEFPPLFTNSFATDLLAVGGVAECYLFSFSAFPLDREPFFRFFPFCRFDLKSPACHR